MEHLVLESAEWVANNSTEVSIDTQAVKTAAKKLEDAWRKGAFNLELWKKDELNPSEANEMAMEWIFVVDTLNFSFWADSEKELPKISYNGKQYTGYWSLCAAINRALTEKVPITSPTYLKDITLEQIEHIFRSDNSNKTPLLEKRMEVLQELGRVTIENFDGKFSNILKQANGSAKKLIEIMTQQFSSYRDEHVYRSRQLYFHKRAQILVADLWACFEGREYGHFDDIDRITMFADYRVPQVLVHLGVLQYTPELTARLQKTELINSGDKEEVEIRGNSIWAVELIKQEMLKTAIDPKLAPVNSIVIDFYLWTYAKQHSSEMKNIPIHKIRTIFY